MFGSLAVASFTRSLLWLRIGLVSSRLCNVRDREFRDGGLVRMGARSGWFGEVADGIEVGLVGSDVAWCDIMSGERNCVLAEYEFLGV